MPTPSHHQRGFTLIEMAIVLLIMGLLLGGGLSVIGTQIDQQRIKDTQRILDDARDALLGFAIANNRLPCPATAATNGIESPVGGGVCTAPYNGFLPAATLGIPGVDANGFLTDAWGTPANRIRYAVTIANANSATKPNGIRTTTMATFTPDLRVCATSTGITATACGAATPLTTNAVAVVFSLGKSAGSAGPDEAANQNTDQVFVSRTPTATFDDLVTWLPPSTLFNRMVQAGALP